MGQVILIRALLTEAHENRCPGNPQKWGGPKPRTKLCAMAGKASWQRKMVTVNSTAAADG
jgi:hypothetical protein